MDLQITAAGTWVDVPEETAEELLLRDLLLDLDGLLSVLPGAIEQAQWTDAFLLCAAAGQILEDGLAGSTSVGGRGWWRRVGRELRRSRLGRIAGMLIAAAVATADRLHELLPSAGRAALLQEDLAALAGTLAQAVLDPQSITAPELEQLVTTARDAAARGLSLPPLLRGQPLRLPSSFRSFDQHPEDIRALARRFSVCWPEKDASLLVVGVRTSGSYLAPLLVSALRAEGYSEARYVTVRPHTTPGRRSRAAIRRAVSRGHLMLLVDDPPVSGRSVADVGRHLARHRASADQVVLVLALHDSGHRLPPALRNQLAVMLPREEWHVQRLLEPAAISKALGTMLPGSSVIVGCRQLGETSVPARGHARALYSVDVQDALTGATSTVAVTVEGAGLGFFGRHNIAIARAMGDAVPLVYGFSDGLVYREWVPEYRQVSLGDPRVSAQIAEYIYRRHTVLPCSLDRSRDLQGCQPVWEVAALIVARVFGRFRLAARPLVAERLVRSLLRAHLPSIVDGRMEADHWLEGTDGGLVKVDFATGAFSNLDLSCFDPLFDLAGASVEMDFEPEGHAARGILRRRYEQLVDRSVDDESCLLYELVHLWNAQRTGRRTAHEIESAAARAMQRYLARVYLADIPAPRDGPLCAIDLDGVLECNSLGFPAATPAGAMALRALRAHGYRALIATGRSLGDLVDRCQAFDLVGGVAEYGTVAFDASSRTVIEVAPQEDLQAVAGLQREISLQDDLELDGRYRYIARVRRVSGDRGRGPVPPRALDRFSPPARGTWQYIVGQHQTDVVPPGIHKGLGLSQLARHLYGAPVPEPLLDFAVGDTESDLSMFDLARVAYAPSNASRGLRRTGVPVVRGSYQAGLSEAVCRLIGHEPGRCPKCAVPAPGPARALLLQTLSIQEAGKWGIPMRVVRLARDLASAETAP